MSKFHSSVSRRDFMKGLGLAGAGIGAAAMAAPAFNDLDELMSSASGPIHKWPWFVKEREQYDFTLPHDLSKLTRTDQRHTLQCSWQGTPEINAWMDDRDGVGTVKKWAAEKAAYDKKGLEQPKGWGGIRNMAYRATFGYASSLDTPNGFLPPKWLHLQPVASPGGKALQRKIRG